MTILCSNKLWKAKNAERNPETGNTVNAQTVKIKYKTFIDPFPAAYRNWSRLPVFNISGSDPT